VELTPSGSGTWNLGGKTVHRVGFGAMRLTGRMPFEEGSPDHYDQAVHVLKRARELGVNHFDTAAFYRSSLHGANELIRAALWPYDESTVIATKVRSHRGGEGNDLRSQVEENLRDLGLDTLDLVYLRVVDSSSVVEDVGALSLMREAGLIRHLGLSGVTEEQVIEASAVTPVVAIQNRYGIGVKRDESVFRLACVRGIAFVPFFSIAAEGKHQGPAPEDHDVVRQIASVHAVSEAAVRIAWTLELAHNVLAIPGTGNVDHLEENVAAGALRLDVDEILALGLLPPGASP
jgi:aryl-alcohol dehydrogenase-like predicted oxidoreductase